MSLGITDHIVVIIAILFFWRGWHTGLLQTLFFPLCLIACGMVAILFFDLTKNVILAITIWILGAITLALIISTMFSIWRTSIDKKYRNYIFWTSRLAGGAFSVFWLGTLSFAAVLLFTLIPFSSPRITSIQKDIMASGSYNWTFVNVLKRHPMGTNIYMTLLVLKDTEAIDKLSQTQEFKDFFSHPKIQDLLSDKNFSRAVTEKNIPALLSNPQLGSILIDRPLMKKLVLLGTRIYEEGNMKQDHLPTQNEEKI